MLFVIIYIFLQDTTTAVVKEKPKVFSKDWFKKVFCVSAETENLMLGEEDDDFEDEQKEENTEVIKNEQEPILSETVVEDFGVKETVTEEEVYEPINVTIEAEAEVELEVQEPERSPTPDPLRAIGAQLLSQLSDYKEDFNKFSNVMEENKPELDVEETDKENQPGTQLEHRKLVTEDNYPDLDVKESVTNNEAVDKSESEKLVTEDEKRMVKNMSNGDAWNHVLGSVLMVSDKKRFY